MRTWSALLGSLLLSTAALANGYLSGYAVDKHATCGNTDLSFCQRDTGGFIGGLPSWLQRNVFWADGNVRAGHFKPGSDYFSSSVGKSGYDGLDAPLVAYVSTHGATSGGVYRFSVNDGSSCTVRSSDMRPGNRNLRYLFFSTCQGVKIGTGDDPTAAGESPARTWGGVLDGVRCIYGVSNNQVDKPDYGSRFWTKWKKEGARTAQSWLDAVYELSDRNVPAVVCFGETADKARDRLENEEQFNTGYANPRHAYWKWLKKKTRDLPAPSRMQSGRLPRRLSVSPVGDLATVFARVPRARDKGAAPRSAAPRRLVDLADGLAYVDDAAGSRGPVSMDDETAVKSAERYLREKGLWTDDLVAASLRLAQAADTENPAPRTLARTVIFEQRIGSVRALDGAAEIRVTLTGPDAVTRVEDARWRHSPEGRDTVDAAEPAGRLPELRARAFAEARGRWPGAAVTLEDEEVGYRQEDGTAVLAYRARLDVAQGAFSRRHEIHVDL